MWGAVSGKVTLTRVRDRIAAHTHARTNTQHTQTHTVEAALVPSIRAHVAARYLSLQLGATSRGVTPTQQPSFRTNGVSFAAFQRVELFYRGIAAADGCEGCGEITAIHPSERISGVCQGSAPIG